MEALKKWDGGRSSRAEIWGGVENRVFRLTFKSGTEFTVATLYVLRPLDTVICFKST